MGYLAGTQECNSRMHGCAGRASKCPYGILLDHHCPLPACLRRMQAAVSSEAAVEAPRTPLRAGYVFLSSCTIISLQVSV